MSVDVRERELVPWTGESYERWLQTHGFHLRRPSPGSSSFHVLHHIQRVVLGSEELDMQRSFSPVSGFPGHDYKNRGEIGRRKDVPTMRMKKMLDLLRARIPRVEGAHFHVRAHVAVPWWDGALRSRSRPRGAGELERTPLR